MSAGSRLSPAIIVQGRYDAVCPIVSADDLHRAWPQGQYVVVPDAGTLRGSLESAPSLYARAERFKNRSLTPRASRERAALAGAESIPTL
jgi:hypothetical protein